MNTYMCIHVQRRIAWFLTQVCQGFREGTVNGLVSSAWEQQEKNYFINDMNCIMKSEEMYIHTHTHRHTHTDI